MSRKRGLTLIELAVAVGLFSLLMLVVAALFARTADVWRSINSADTAHRELRKARAALGRDLALANPARLSRAPVPSSLGGGPDGEALWFLSPVDPASGQLVHKQDSSQPFWQRNILYYLVVPDDHDATFGMSCIGAPGPNGYEAACPHKVLIRKEIDSGVATIPSDEATEEVLVSDIAPYLTRPAGYDLSGMSEPGLQEARIVAVNLLTFESAATGVAGEVTVDLRAVAIEEARREISLGTLVVYAGPYTRLGAFSVFLQN